MTAIRWMDDRPFSSSGDATRLWFMISKMYSKCSFLKRKRNKLNHGKERNSCTCYINNFFFFFVCYSNEGPWLQIPDTRCCCRRSRLPSSLLFDRFFFCTKGGKRMFRLRNVTTMFLFPGSSVEWLVEHKHLTWDLRAKQRVSPLNSLSCHNTTHFLWYT